MKKCFVSLAIAATFLLSPVDAKAQCQGGFGASYASVSSSTSYGGVDPLLFSPTITRVRIVNNGFSYGGGFGSGFIGNGIGFGRGLGFRGGFYGGGFDPALVGNGFGIRGRREISHRGVHNGGRRGILHGRRR